MVVDRRDPEGSVVDGRRSQITRFVRWVWTSPVAALSVVLLLSLPAVTPRLYASDEIEYFAYLRSVWFDRDLSFDNEYRYFYDRGIARDEGFRATFLESTTATGHRQNFAPVGTAILWTPFYVLADGGVRIARLLGSEVPADGFSRPYIVAVTYGSAVYGFLAVVLSAFAVRRVVGGRVGAVAAVWLGTPLVFYMYIAPGFSHAASAFAVAAFFLAWLHVRRHWSWAGLVALGALAALMGMTREQDLFIAIGPALDFAVTALRSVRRDGPSVRVWLGRAVVGLLTAAVCYVPQAVAYVVLHGRLGPSPVIEQKMTWTSPNLWRVLASPENGLLFWTPLALPALAGLVGLAVRRTPGTDQSGASLSGGSGWVGTVALLMVLTQLYVSGSLDTWAAAGSFGQRRLVGLTVFFALGLAGLFEAVRQGWRRAMLQGVVMVCVWWNIGLIVQFGSGLMSRRHLDLSLNAYHNFVTVPRTLPALTYRYFFDRESFYRGSARALR